jgi:hypothetical protein
MQYQQLDNKMKPVESVEIDNETLLVTDHKGNGLVWDEPPLDDSEDSYLQFSTEPITNSDGLTYLFCIRGDHLYDDDPVYRVKGTIPPQEFDREENANHYIMGLEEEGIDTAKLEVEELRYWWISLEVVPVSVSEQVAHKTIGGYSSDSSRWDEALAGRKRDGDWRESVYDLQSYGVTVPVLNVRVLEDKIEEAIEQAKSQAVAVEGMFGFYMDRPVNRMGESGWDWLRRAEAFPGQWLNPETTAGTKAKCHDCSEEKDDCTVHTTIYNIDAHICRRCLEDWVPCCTCNILLPIEPQSWSGVEWLKHNHQYYCPRCYDELLRGPDCPGIIRQGADLSPSALKAHILNFVKAGPANWEEVETWRFPFESGEQDWLNCVDEAKELMVTYPGHQFCLAFTALEQFGQSITLFHRSPPA